MKDLHYISGNNDKFRNASKFMADFGITLHQDVLGLDEIQADSSQDIVIKKSTQAFAIVKQPLFVNDASWHIPALGGFPGPFMKYMVKWLTEGDILKLMKGKTDRTIILSDTIGYTDGNIQKVFNRQVKGMLLEQPEGEPNGPFITRLISFTDDGRSLASVRSEGFTERELPLWHEFAEWVKTQ